MLGLQLCGLCRAKEGLSKEGTWDWGVNGIVSRAKFWEGDLGLKAKAGEGILAGHTKGQRPLCRVQRKLWKNELKEASERGLRATLESEQG